MNKILKSFFGLGLVLLACGQLVAQKYDNNWFYGRYPEFQDTSLYPSAGTGQISFTNDTFQTWPEQLNIPFSECNTSISDADGNLLFYTNGMRILDSTHHIIENGDSLNYGDAWEHFEHDYGYPPQLFGMKLPNSIFIIPTPGRDSNYTIIHIRNDSLSSAYWSGTVCKTIVNMKSNGLFKVVEKNVPISTVQAPLSNISMAKHANGRDWWIVFQERTSNSFYKYLLSQDTIEFISLQHFGNVVSSIDYGVSKFSPDGLKYLRHAFYAGIEIFDFDRCTGELSNMFQLSVPQIDSFGDPISVSAIPEFSPNSRFLYEPISIGLGQWDLQTGNIFTSLDTVGFTDSFIDTIPFASGAPWRFFYPQIGPDGKIYFSGDNSRFYSVLNNPDSRGFACDYCNRCKILPKQSVLTISQFPNYRLGRLIGSACDTIYNDLKPIYTEAPWLKVFPNPANDEVQFDYNWIEWDRISDCELRISDLSGRVVLSQRVPKYSTRQSFSVKQLAAGTYMVSIAASSSTQATEQRQIQKLATCKLVKQ